MANPVYLWLTNQDGAVLNGPVRKIGCEGSIEVVALSHTISIPTDSNTGHLTGERTHEPFKITKVVDKTSNYLLQAVTTGQSFQSAEIREYEVNSNGELVVKKITTLENVKVVRIDKLMESIKDQSREAQVPYELISLRYEKITWLFKEGTISHSDSWQERRAG